MINTNINASQLAGSQLGLQNRSQTGQLPQLKMMESQAKAESKSGMDDSAKQVFQEFVAGTFYQQMLKALRSSEEEVPYIGGGQAEKLFRGQLDMQIASDLAQSHGETLSSSLYESFASRFDHTS